MSFVAAILVSVEEQSLVRAIGVREMAAATVNNVIGSGIFALPAAVAAVLGPAAIVAYVVCAVAIGLVALSLAEAGSRVSVTGGTYAYVEQAFGQYVGFLVGVLFWFGSQTLAAGAVASLFIDTFGALVPVAREPIVRAALLIVLFGVLAVVNIRGVAIGTRLIEVVTVVKVAPLVVLAVLGLFAGHAANLAWTHVPTIREVGRASLVLMFAFMGIETALTPSGEVKDPTRTVPHGMLLGLAAVVVLYSALQLASQGLLGDDLAHESAAPLAAAAERVFGPDGRLLMLVAAMVSTFGYVCGDMLATPRVLFAFARDRFLPRVVEAVHPRYRTPYVAIALHAVIACACAITGTFRTLTVLAVVSLLLVYLVCCLSTLALRRRDVRADGAPFVLPGGPVIPLLGCVVVVWLLSSATRSEFMAVAIVLLLASVGYGVRSRLLPPAAPRRRSGPSA